MSDPHTDPDLPEEDRLPKRPMRPTMIKGLTPRLPERGHVKIGELGDVRQSRRGNPYQLPQKLDHFRITTLDRDPTNNNFVIDKALYERLELPPEPTELPVRLLYDDIGLNFPTRYASFSGKKLWCSGDGETAQRWSKVWGEPLMKDPFPVRCPCHRIEAAYEGKDQCKINGKLSFLIDGAGGVGGVWVFRTTSYNSVTGILSSLALIRSITGGILANIPLQLRVQKKLAQKPADGSAVTIFVVTLEYPGDPSELLEAGHQIALHRAQTHMSIANIEEEARRSLPFLTAEDAVLPGDIAEDIVGEFYPEQVVEEEPPPPRPSRFAKEEEAPPDQPVSDPLAGYPAAPYERDTPYQEDPLQEGADGLPPVSEEEFMSQVAAAEQDAGDGGDDQREPIFGVAPPELFEIVDENGEVSHVLLEEVVGRCTAIYHAAAKRGRQAWQGASESSPVEALREAGHADVAQQVIDAWRAAMPRQAPPQEPQKPPTRQLGTQRPPTQLPASEGTSPASTPASAAPTARVPQSSGDGHGQTATTPASRSRPQRPAPATAAARDSLWERQSFLVGIPTKPDRTTDYLKLRNIYLDRAPEARTGRELRKFIEDNGAMLRELRQTFPQYEKAVRERFHEVEIRIANQQEAQREQRGLPLQS